MPHGATVSGTKSGTWSYMTYGSYSGYMMSVFLDEEDTSTPSGNWVPRWTNTPGETVNVRSGAGTNYSIVRRLSHATKVEVNAPNTTWSQVRLYGTTSILGYIKTEFLLSTDPGSSSGGSENEEGNYTICLTVETDRFGTGTSVRFRKEASTTSKELASIACGTSVMVTTHDGEWLPTKYNGMTGYIMAKFLSGSTEYTKWVSGVTRTVPYHRDEAVAYARQYTSNGTGTASYNNASYKPVGDSSTNINKDCANYVSQCRFAGGMPMHDGWYYRYPGNVSNPSVNAAWKGTNSQKKAIAAHKFGERVYDISQLKKGDIVYSYDTTADDGTFGHVVMITEDVGSNAQTTVCGHTTNQKDASRSKKAKDAYFHIYDELPVKSTDYFG